MKQNKALTILFGLIPGAGQMYLGLMKKGLAILLGLATFNLLNHVLNIYFLNVFIPVIWIYSFFDTLHLSELSFEERTFTERLFIERIQDFIHQDWRAFIAKYRTVLSIGIIILGVEVFYSNVLIPLQHFLPNFAHWPFRLFHYIHNSLYSLVFIGAGAYLLFRYRAEKEVD